MSKRHPVAVVLLTLITFTAYAYYWLYRTTDELRRESGRDDLSPAVDVILTMITFGLWGIWASYRNAKIAHETLADRGEKHTDRSLAVGVFAGLSIVTGSAWLVAMVLLQEDFNRLAEPFERFQAAEPYEEATGRAPHRVRVDLGSSDRAPSSADREHQSAWENAPSAPVFESDAPAPIVF